MHSFHTSLRDLAIAIMIFAGGPWTYAEGQWVSATQFAAVNVVLSDKATVPERAAAERLARGWELVTGHRATLSPSPFPGKLNIWIGKTDNDYLDRVNLEGLGEEGIVIFTVPASPSGGPGLTRHLLLLGGGDRGVGYAVSQFFEDYMGARLLAPGEPYIPAPPSFLPEIDYRFVPPFSYRDLNYRGFVDNPGFAAVNKLNGHWANIPTEQGGHLRYHAEREGFGHTFFRFVNPDQYFNEHPEYFAEVDGMRTPDAQLCLTNDDVVAITIQKALEQLRAAEPLPQIISISQMDRPDTSSWCTCSGCRALDEHEGSHSGTLIHFVNRVAEGLAKEYPRIKVDTLAYMHTRKPPRHVRPHRNVIVRVSDIECEFGRPLADEDSERNRSFVADLRRWRKIATTVYVWDYTQNWYSFQGPHPNIHVLQPNLQLFAEIGVDGVFEQASPTSPHSDFEMLKGYILAHCLWNPYSDWKRLYDDFLSTYYRRAAPFVDRYLQLVTSKIQDDNVALSFRNTMGWMDFDTVVSAQQIFAEAFGAVKDATVLERLRYAQLPVQYSALVCRPKITVSDSAYTYARPPSQTLDEYWDMIRGYGVTHLEDWPIGLLRKRLDNKTPPRERIIPIEKIENDAYEVWVLPELAGAICRLYDKRTGADLFPDYETAPQRNGICREINTNNEGTRTVYRVVGRTQSALHLIGQLESGLTVAKSIVLDGSAGPLNLRWLFVNESTKPLIPNLRLRTRVAGLPGEKTKLITYGDAGWNTAENRDPSVRAFALQRAGGVMVNTFEPKDYELVGYDTKEKSIDITLTPHNTPINPGETRVAHATFTIHRRRPAIP